MRNIWIVAFLLLSGCTVVAPHVEEYRIITDVKIENSDAKLCKERSLKVGKVFSSSDLMSHSMKYTKDNYMEYTFNNSKWASSPTNSISAALVKSINNQNLFASVTSYKSRSKSDLVLETNVEEFIQYFSKDNNQSLVRVRFSMALINVKNNRVLNTKKLVKELNVKSLDARGGVEALSQALSDVLEQNNQWLSSVCK